MNRCVFIKLQNKKVSVMENKEEYGETLNENEHWYLRQNQILEKINGTIRFDKNGCLMIKVEHNNGESEILRNM